MVKNSNNNYQPRKQYNRGDRNNRNGKRFNRRHTMDVELVIPAEVEAEICDDILDVIYSAPFEKLSYALICPRYLIDPSVDNKNKTTIAGYINSYDRFSNKFTVTVFDGVFEIISALDNLHIEVDYITRRDGTFNLITRIKIVGDPKPVAYASIDTEEESAEAEEADPNQITMEEVTDIEVAAEPIVEEAPTYQ